MIYHVRHTTTYDYSEPVSLCHNLVHLAARIDRWCHHVRAPAVGSDE
jgi:hypothetical protein